MALVLGFLMVHAAAGRTPLGGHDQGADLVLLQQHVQKIQSEQQSNNSYKKKLGPAFEKAMFDTESEKRTEKIAFEEIEHEVNEWEKLFMEEEHMLFESYKQALGVQENETNTEKKKNHDLTRESEEEEKLNDERMQKAQHLREECLQLSYNVRLLGGDFLTIMDRASAALETAEKGLSDPSLEALFQKKPPSHQKMALTALETAEKGLSDPSLEALLPKKPPSPQKMALAALENAEKRLSDPWLEALLQKTPPSPQKMALLSVDMQKESKPIYLVNTQKTSEEAMRSLQDLFAEIISRQNASTAKVQAAFLKEMEATEKERSMFLKERSGLIKRLEEAKAKGQKLEDAIRFLDTTHERLLGARSLLSKTPELMSERSTADEAAVKTAPAVKAAPVVKPVDDQVDAATWADLAFQVRGSQADYDRVFAASASERESMYDELKNGPTHWATQAFQFKGNQVDYDRVMAVEPNRRKDAYEALTRGEPFTFGPIENAEKP